MWSSWVLVLVLATSNASQTGATSVVVPFSTEQRCLAAGAALTKGAEQRENYVLVWGCFPS